MNVPSFTLQGSDGKTYRETDFSNGRFVLYAYPKDLTPGCTIQAKQFQERQKEFSDLDVQVFGISADSISLHEKFCSAFGLTFSLLSDPEKTLLEPIGAWREKVNFGKRYMGIARSTYLIEDGKIIKTWKAARANGNADTVLKWWTDYLQK